MNYPLFSSGFCLPVNCSVKEGNLNPEYSLKPVNSNSPQGVICAGYSAGANRFLLADGEKIYASQGLNSYSHIFDLNSETPFFLEHKQGGKTFSVIVDGAAAAAHCGEYFTGFVLGKNLTCGAYHCGRVFASDGMRILWSGEGGLTDWEEKLYGAGYLDLDTRKGKVLDIIEYGEKLAIIREFGIDLMRAYGTPETFACGIEDYGCERILKGTAKTVAGKIYFCTASGIFCFDGAIKRLKHSLSPDISLFECAESYAQKYFIGCKSTELQKRVVLCYDTQSGLDFYIDAAPTCMTAAKGELYLFCEDGVFALEKGGAYRVEVKDINFKNGKNKTLAAVYTGGNCSLTVKTGEKMRAFNGAKGLIKTSLRGREFTVELCGDTPLKGVELITEEQIGI